MIFAREGCAVRRAAAQNHPLRPAPLRAFSSLFLALLAVLFFFSRRATVAARALLFIIPCGPRRFFFSSVCAATPPRHNGRVPENSSLGRRPFPRPPRLFRRFPSRLSPLSRAAPVSPLPRSLSLLCPFFSPFFLSRPPLRLHLLPPSTSIRPSAVSVARAFAALFSFGPRGVF